MIRGVSFRVAQALDSKVLWHITKSVESMDYTWQVIDSQSEVWANPLDNDFFEKVCYSTEDFMTCVSRRHYAIFAKLQAFIGPHNLCSIHTFEEFRCSECQLLLLLWDCCFVSIFVKDQNVSESIYQYMVYNGYRDVEYITNENDRRTKLDIL